MGTFNYTPMCTHIGVYVFRNATQSKSETHVYLWKKQTSSRRQSRVPAALSPVVCRVGGTRHGSCRCRCLLGFAVSTTQRRRAHPGPSWLGHAGGAGGHRRVHPVLAARAVAASHRYGLAGPLAVHGAACVHPQTVGHAGAGAAVAGAGGPAVAGGPRIVTWKGTKT